MLILGRWKSVRRDDLMICSGMTTTSVTEILRQIQKLLEEHMTELRRLENTALWKAS
jgi:ribosomal silencing factor RsfS